MTKLSPSMSHRRSGFYSNWLGLAIATLLVAHSSEAQNIVVSSPTQTNSGGSYEVVGTGINYDDGNFRFSWQPNAVPPFGGYDRNNDARLSINSGPLSLSLFGSQGSNQSTVTQTPSVTIPNGGTGYFIDTQLRPFVTSFVPVVGSQPVLQGPSIQERWQAAQQMPPSKAQSTVRRTKPSQRMASSAQVGDVSVAEIRRRQAVSSSTTSVVEQLLGKARVAAAAKKWATAQNHLRNALRRATDDERVEIYALLEEVHAHRAR